MAEVFPSSLIPRENPNLRLGIKIKYANIDNISDLISNSPLFKSQIEALQVGIRAGE